MRSHRRSAPVEHALLAGGPEDLPAIGMVLSVLPSDAYGQVFIEACPDAVLPRMRKPARVSVHRVDHGALAEAIDAWLAEWMPHDPAADQGDRAVSIWVGAHSSALVNDQCSGLGDLVDRL